MKPATVMTKFEKIFGIVKEMVNIRGFLRTS